MRARKPLVWLIFLFLFAYIVPSHAAANQPVFELTVNEKERQVTITVQANSLDDMYAYDLLLGIDTKQLKLMSGKSELTGFTIDPILKGNKLKLAFTKVGNTNGVNGNARLATFVFEKLDSKTAAISLDTVELIDSDLNKAVYYPAIQVTIPGGKLLTDIAGHWAEAAILEAVKQGFVTGFTDSTFRPESYVTRGEFAAMMVRVLKLPVQPASTLSFSDNSSIPAWAQPYIGAAVNAGLMEGYGDHTFRPNQLIKWAEIAAMAVRALGVTTTAGGNASFADAHQIQSWAMPYVEAAVEAGIMKGRGGNRFFPQQHATRAEAVVVLQNLLQALAGTHKPIE